MQEKEGQLRTLFDSCQGHMDEAAKDLDKFVTGNKAAGGRLRKNIQEVKKMAKPIRDLVTEIKKERK